RDRSRGRGLAGRTRRATRRRRPRHDAARADPAAGRGLGPIARRDAVRAAGRSRRAGRAGRGRPRARPGRGRPRGGWATGRGGLVAQSARAAARALTYVNLARAAAREGATAREVEVAEVMRRQASARHDDELGPWRVAAEYRSALRTTGAAWSAQLTADGRLA